MIKQHFHSESANAYMQLETSGSQDLGRRLAQRIMADPGTIYSFLPDHVIDSKVLECLDSDILQLTGEEQQEINFRDAEIIYQFLRSNPTAAFVVYDLNLRNRPDCPQLKIAFLRSQHPAEVKTYTAISLKEGTVETIEDFLGYVSTRQIISFLTYLPFEILESAESVEIDENLATSMVAGCRHVIVGSYDYYSRLFWSCSDSQADSSANSVLGDFPVLTTPAKLEFDHSFFFHFQQKLCNTLWAPWVQPYAGSMREGGKFWCFAPISGDPFFRCKMSAPFRLAYPKSHELRIRQARTALFDHLGTYLKDHPNAFMLAQGQSIWWPESEPLLPGRSSDGGFRIVVHTQHEFKYNYPPYKNHFSYVFRAILAGPDTTTCIARAWQTFSRVSCCVIIDAPGDPFALIKDDRALTDQELEEEIRPFTSHVIVGGFRNDIPLVWSREGTACAPISEKIVS